jgi:Uracil DNA glycosylase superfamily
MTSLTNEFPDVPRSLQFADVISFRRRMLDEPHIAPLTAYVRTLRSKYPSREFQDFDPLDGGVGADILFLLEKPGPMTSPTGKRPGSGFISRNNDDPTAEAVFEFMKKAGIERKRVVQWNVIPGWNGTIKIYASEVREGVEELKNLLALLTRVRTVVLVGRRAERAKKLIEEMNLRTLVSAHPSHKVRSFNRERWEAIPEQWAIAKSAVIGVTP